MAESFEEWFGNREIVTDRISHWPTNALQATFDLDDPPLAEGDSLPPLWHWLFFLPTVQQSRLGHDGHPSRGTSYPLCHFPAECSPGRGSSPGPRYASES